MNGNKRCCVVDAEQNIRDFFNDGLGKTKGTVSKPQKMAWSASGRKCIKILCDMSFGMLWCRHGMATNVVVNALKQKYEVSLLNADRRRAQAEDTAVKGLKYRGRTIIGQTLQILIELPDADGRSLDIVAFSQGTQFLICNRSLYSVDDGRPECMFKDKNNSIWHTPRSINLTCVCVDNVKHRQSQKKPSWNQFSGVMIISSWVPKMWVEVYVQQP